MNSDRQRLLKEFADLLWQVEEWRDRQGEPGTYDVAGRLTATLTELLFASGIADVIRHRVYADARDRDEDALPAPTDIRGAKGLLGAMARFLLDLSQPIITPVAASTMIVDTLERWAGREPIIGGKGNARPKISLNAAKRRSILTAHYFAYRDRTNWLTEHARIIAPYTDGGRNEWNMAVAPEDRELARSAGTKRRLQQPLSAAEREMEELVLHQTVEEQGIVLAKLLAGGKIA